MNLNATQNSKTQKLGHRPRRRAIYQALAMGGLMTCVTAGAGGYDSSSTLEATSQAAVGIELSHETNTKAATQTQVFLTQGGGIYVFRLDDGFYFWSINAAGDQLTLLDHVILDMSTPQALTLNLAPSTEGVFYADDLVTDVQHSFRFQGQLSAGKIAIPLGKEAFLPLFDAAPMVNDTVTIDGNTPELLDALSQQLDIYQAADAAVADALILSEASTQIMADQVLSNRATLLAEAAVGDQLSAHAEAEQAQLNQDFAQQIQADVAAFEQLSADLAEQVSIEFTAYHKQLLPCLEQHRSKLEQNLDQLGRNISSREREFEEDPKLEDAINTSDTLAAQLELAMNACGAGAGALEQADPSGVVDPLTYEAIAARAENLQQQLEADAADWQNHIAPLPEQLMWQVDTDVLVAKTESFEHRFDNWISPTYLNQDGFVSSPQQKNLSKAAADEADLAWLERMSLKGQDQLCEEETFNISFNIGVVGVVIGTWWDDQIITGNEPNLILALPGNDCVESHGGVDLVLGMPGRDRIFLGDHHDIAHGGWGMDEIHGSAGNSYSFTIQNVEFEVDLGNLIMGGADDDFLFGGETAADRGENGVIEPNGFTDIILGDTLLFGQDSGNDFVDGEMGIDFIFGQRGNDTLMNLGAGVITIASIDTEFGSYFFGNDGDDTITGSNTNLLSPLGDFIFGAAGNDSFNGNAGRDFIFGADGNDNGTAGPGNDYVFGSRGDDNLNGGDGIDLLFGGLGNDNVAGGNGLDLVFGNDGNDRVQGDGGYDLTFGNAGNDTVLGGDFADLMFGGPGQDVMLGQDGWDLMFGNADGDNMSGNNGWDMMFGNRGTDQLFGNDGADLIFGNANDADGIELINGGGGVDLLFGNAGREQIFGEAGLDLIFGNADNDEIFGGDGADLVFGNGGDDVINGNAGSDLLFGNDGDDQILGDGGTDAAFGGAGCDLMNGGNDPDLMFGNDNNDRLEGGAASDLLFGNNGLDEVFGQQGADLLFGNDDRDRLDGGDQIDVMFAGGGNDFMVGGNGNDLMFGNGGADFINGGNNGDMAFGGDNNDTMVGAGGNDFLFGNGGNDRLNSGNDTDFTFGGDGNDRLRAVEGQNFAFGNKHDDVLDGYWASGWDARDFLFGNQHSDDLTGNQNSQRDIRSGGSGSDNKAWNTTWVSAAEFNATWNPPGCQ
ncbi:hypothetical protein [Marinicella meishanensis]|uniref:hypothetical protein n=1 Tax=Marinicella meishanensis TaxID=2873263 RepID=UPI001CBC1DE7|nr:hypothetical protein [Marinicella sp. NBU2979]